MGKLSRKALLAEGKRLNGIQLNCNPYTFDNVLHYISNLETVPAGSYLCGNEENEKRVNEIIKKIRERFPNSIGCGRAQLYYSAGLYGNNGQLYLMYILDSDGNRTENDFYIYF